MYKGIVSIIYFFQYYIHLVLQLQEQFFSIKYSFNLSIICKVIPFAHKISSKSIGFISINVSDPTGIDFGCLPYPLTPSKNPVPITSNLSSSLKI